MMLTEDSVFAWCPRCCCCWLCSSSANSETINFVDEDREAPVSSVLSRSSMKQLTSTKRVDTSLVLELAPEGKLAAVSPTCDGVKSETKSLPDEGIELFPDDFPCANELEGVPFRFGAKSNRLVRLDRKFVANRCMQGA